MVPQCIQITIMIEKSAIQDWSRMDSEVYTAILSA